MFKKNKKFKIIITIITVATLCFIWVHSMIPREGSAAESGWVMNLIKPFLSLFINPDKITQHLVRKMAHLAEYTVLGVELRLLSEQIMNRLYALYAIAAGLTTAIIDEVIQIFSHRGPMVKDVCLDLVGVLIGVIIISIISLCIRNKPD